MGGQAKQEDRPRPRSARASMRRITAAGCLAMVYVIAISCPVGTEFFRRLGATEFQFGLLGGIPLAMLFLQFVGAAFTNRLRRRKAVWMPVIILARLLHLLVVFVPVLLPPRLRPLGIVLAIALLALAAGLANLGVPLWFSWMADLIPHRVLNRYWGSRQRWMYATWTVAYLGVAAAVYFARLPALEMYPILISIGVTAGVVDIALFLNVHEPPNQVVERGERPLAVLLEPLRHREYRTFVTFSTVRMAATMFGAAFMQLYVLDVLKVPIWDVTLIWCTSGLGSAVASVGWGRIADRHGQRPILTVCSLLKPMIAIVFVLLTRDTVFWVLPIAFFFDGMLNAGTMVAQNGYMMKIAPRRNRSMFVAAILGMAGICGGLGSIAGGAFLKSTSWISWEGAGRVWTNYHLLFLLSALMRFGAFCLARRIKEDKSSRSLHVLNDIRGAWPLRFIRFPTGLYRDADRGK